MKMKLIDRGPEGFILKDDVQQDFGVKNTNRVPL